MYTIREKFSHARQMVHAFGYISAFRLEWEVRGDRKRRGQ